MLKKQAIGGGVLGLALLLAGFCPTLLAQTPTIAAYTESHTRSEGADSVEKKQPWQTVDLSAIPAGDGAALGWRQWGGRDAGAGWAHYNGSQGASSGPNGGGGISDLVGYEPVNTYVGRDSDFFVTYNDPQTSAPVKDSRTFVFAFDSLSFTVPADAKPEILRLWTGAFACDGALDADLLSADGDVLASYTKTLAQSSETGDVSNPDFLYGYCRLRFQGSGPGQILRVRWRAGNRQQPSANIMLQADVLTSAAAKPAAH